METNKPITSPKYIIVICQIGLILSFLSLVIQFITYIILPCSRKLDLKILTQLTMYRFMSVLLECLVMYQMVTSHDLGQDIIYAIGVHSDCALICWMFVFTKNLYDKVIQVFTINKLRFVLVSVLIYVLTLPVAVLSFLLQRKGSEPFDIFYKVYTIVKFLVLAVNLWFLIKIYRVAITKNRDKDIRGILRTCMVAFILIIITCLQVFVPDLILMIDKIDGGMTLPVVACIIKAYQVVAITTMFLILLNTYCEQSIGATIARRLSIMCQGLNCSCK